MKISEIIPKLDLKLLNEIDLLSDIKGCYIGDLLSNVMSHAQEGDIWLTVQTHQNVVAVAILLNLAGIMFVEGHQPLPETVEKANKEGVCLLKTEKSAYETACKLHSFGIGRSQ